MNQFPDGICQIQSQLLRWRSFWQFGLPYRCAATFDDGQCANDPLRRCTVRTAADVLRTGNSIDTGHIHCVTAELGTATWQQEKHTYPVSHIFEYCFEKCIMKTNQHKAKSLNFSNCAYSTGSWTPWPWHLPEGKVFAGHAYLIWRWCLAEWNSLSWTSWNFNAKTFRENAPLKFNVFMMAMSMPLSPHGRLWTWLANLHVSACKCVIINASKRNNYIYSIYIYIYIFNIYIYIIYIYILYIYIYIYQFHALIAYSFYNIWSWNMF